MENSIADKKAVGTIEQEKSEPNGVEPLDPIRFILPPLDLSDHQDKPLESYDESQNHRTFQTDFGSFTVNHQGQMIDYKLLESRIFMERHDDDNAVDPSVMVDADCMKRSPDKYVGSRMYLLNTSKTERRILGSVKERQQRLDRGVWKSDAELLLILSSALCGIDYIFLYPRVWLQYGGFAFQIAYIICCVILALPLLIQESALGQYTAHGLVGLLPEMAPALKGLSFSFLVVMIVTTGCYMPELASTAVYGYFAIRGDFPWASCDQQFYSSLCFTRDLDKKCANNGAVMYLGRNCVREEDICSPGENTSVPVQFKVACVPANDSSTIMLNVTKAKSLRVSAGTLFFENNVHDFRTGSDGSLHALSLWGLLLCWLLTIIVSAAGFRGVRYTIVFLFLLPILALVMLSVHILSTVNFSLDDWVELVPDLSKLGYAKCWLYAAIYSLKSTNIGTGIISTIYSRNLLTHDCKKSSLQIIVIAIFLTSLLGLCYVLILGQAAQTVGLRISDLLAQNHHHHPFILISEALLCLKNNRIVTSVVFIASLLLGLGCSQIFVLTIDMGLRELKRFNSLKTHTSICIICGLFFMINVLFMFPTAYYAMLTVSQYVNTCYVVLLSFGLVASVSFILGSPKLLHEMQTQMFVHMRWSHNYLKVIWYILLPVLLVLFVATITSQKEIAIRHRMKEPPAWTATLQALMIIVPCILFVGTVFHMYWSSGFQDLSLFASTALWRPGLMPEELDPQLAGSSSHFLITSAPSLMTRIYSDITKDWLVPSTSAETISS